MGINDRDYARHAPPHPSTGRIGRGERAPMSVTGWIIALCCAVYIFNVFGPKVPTLVDVELLGTTTKELSGIKRSEFKFSQIVVPIVRGRQEGVISLENLKSGDRVVGLGVQEVRLGERAVARQKYSLEPLLMSWGFFSTAKALAWNDPIGGWGGLQVWRFVTFQFLHSQHSINHILFNMIALFFFGGMVEQYLGRKRFLAFYLLCGACGALTYLILNGAGVGCQALFGPDFKIPGLLINDPLTPLVGASAGVFGVILAGAYLAPNAEVLLFFIIPMKLRTLAYGLLCWALLVVIFGGANAGGEAAHIGGAIAGFYFIRNPHHLHGMFDFMGQFDPTSRTAKARAAVRRSGVQHSEIDRILAKIRESGLHSLTDDEKRTLREASRR